MIPDLDCRVEIFRRRLQFSRHLVIATQPISRDPKMPFSPGRSETLAEPSRCHTQPRGIGSAGPKRGWTNLACQCEHEAPALTCSPFPVSLWRYGILLGLQDYVLSRARNRGALASARMMEIKYGEMKRLFSSAPHVELALREIGELLNSLLVRGDFCVDVNLLYCILTSKR